MPAISPKGNNWQLAEPGKSRTHWRPVNAESAAKSAACRNTSNTPRNIAASSVRSTAMPRVCIFAGARTTKARTSSQAMNAPAIKARAGWIQRSRRSQGAAEEKSCCSAHREARRTGNIVSPNATKEPDTPTSSVARIPRVGNIKLPRVSVVVARDVRVSKEIPPQARAPPPAAGYSSKWHENRYNPRAATGSAKRRNGTSRAPRNASFITNTNGCPCGPTRQMSFAGRPPCPDQQRCESESMRRRSSSDA